LPLPALADTLRYLRQVQEGVLAVIDRGPTPDQAYFILLSIFHEDMHGEAFLYTRQTFGYPCPCFSSPPVARGMNPAPASGGAFPGDVSVPGGTFLVGATQDEPFVFDNEKWAHPVVLRPFAIARAPVTQSEFLAFVEADGYSRSELWSPAGWRWRESTNACLPLYWRHDASGWRRRDFNHWVPLEPDRPIVHVNWYEADAYCRWAGRRLPTEAEWEVAAAGGADGRARRRFPWGDDPAKAMPAQVDGYGLGCCDVAGFPGGDSPFGCRQMIGNVWEWTSDHFAPYPGFQVDPYREYSQPWFGTHKVLRGGAWTTRRRLLRNTWRNFYKPDRRDIWAGFRTCAKRP
jgi:iron(II)-dependent oxidoreductase